MRRSASLPCMLFLLALAGAGAEDAPIRHRFLAVDESRGKLHYADQTDPAKGWSIAFPARCRDVQLVGGGRVLVSAASGYAEYDLRTQALLKEVKDPALAGTIHGVIILDDLDPGVLNDDASSVLGPAPR